MRGVKPAGKAKSKAMEERENTESKEDSDAKVQCRNRPRRCRGMKMRRTIGSKWCPTLDQVGSYHQAEICERMVEEESEEERREEEQQEVEDECEEKEAKEHRRGVEQAESGGEKEHETEE